MSESKPRKPSRTSNSRESSAALTRAARRDKVWHIVSLCLHVALLAALAYLTPVRELVKEVVQPTKPQATMSGRELEKLADAIKVRAADQIRENAEELDRVLEEMAQVYHSIEDDFAAFERQQRRQAPQDAREEMEAAVEHMERAAESIQAEAPIEQIDRHQALAEQAQQRALRELDMVQYDVSEPAAEQRQAAQIHQGAKELHDQHRQQIEQTERRREAAETRQGRVAEWQERLDKAKEKGDERQVKRNSDRLQREEAEAQKAREELEAATAERDRVRQRSIEAQRNAVEAQREALEAMRQTVTRRESALAEQQEADSEQPSEVQALLKAVAEEQPAAEAEPDLADLYGESRRSEDHIAEALKEVRAMDLAMVRDVELADARQDIDLVRPVRPDLDTDLLRASVRTGQRFEQHKEEVGKALRETTSMVNLAHRMLEMANQSAAKMEFGTQAVAESALALERPELELRIREMAMEDVSGRFSNMSGMMEMMAQEGTEEEQQQGDAGEGALARLPAQDIRDLTSEEEDEGAQTVFSEGEGEGDFPQLSPEVVKVGARRIASDGRPARYIYLDSWYTIGPFPNPNRVNIDREFPPDSIVDLDATYIGKGGRTIRWRFVQSHQPMMVPPNAEEYGIWYAYTELYCEEPMDVWIAAGTDDRGILKINGVTVWISSKRLKGWTVDEVWRKVHLQKGINRILYRVENGWLYIGYSMTLRLAQ